MHLPSTLPDLDSELMLRVQSGDEASFERLTEIHRSTLYASFSRRTRNPAEAEELVQDVFLRVYRARHRWHPTSAKFNTWLFRISVNVALNHFRDNRRRSRDVSLDRRLPNDPVFDFPDRSHNAEQQLARSVMLKQVRAAVEALPPKQRQAVLLHKSEGMDYRSIADELGCSIASLKSTMFRAYRALRTQLAHLESGGRA
jgi:RNA polymerase sigma-70 factor (ECF subfamily)